LIVYTSAACTYYRYTQYLIYDRDSHALQNNSSRYLIDSASKTAHYGKAGMEMETEMETGIEN